MRRRRLLTGLLATGLVFAACFLVILGLLTLGEPGGLILSAARVALVEVEGMIVDAERVVRELEDHADDPSVRAVVIRIQSPGGVVAPTQEIHDAILRVRDRKKPVVASMGSVAASGGYYLAAASDRIVANPGTLTGSIGVLMQLAEIEGLLKKVGVRYEVVKAGRHKDIGNPGRSMTEAERAILQELLDDMYEQFVTAVAQGRGLTEAEVRALADGRVYSGRRARELRLVDQLGGLEEAILTAGSLAKIPGRPRILRARRALSLMDLIEWLTSRSALGHYLAGHRTLASLGAGRVPLYLME